MNLLQRGRIIAIEGGDGSGKSTLVRGLADELQAHGYTVLNTREPGGTVLGQALRGLLQEQKTPLVPMAEAFLFAADRAQHWHEKVIPARDEGKLVISDRMADSTRVYQGMGRGLDENVLEFLINCATYNQKPDITIYVATDPEVAWQRLISRQEGPSRFERDRTFFDKISAGFEALYRNRADVIKIDGTLAPELLITYTTHVLINWLIATHEQCYVTCPSC